MATKKSPAKRLNTKPRFNRAAALLLAVVMVGVGIFVITFSRAAGPGRFYLDPSSAQVPAGATVTVSVREDSGSANVNAVQADLTYDAGSLEYVSMDPAGSAFGIAAPVSASAGLVSLVRGTIIPVSGDQLVAKLTFRVKSGSSAVAFRNTSVLLDSSSNNNILGNTDGTVLAVLAEADPLQPTPAPAPQVTPAPTPAPTPSPVVGGGTSKPNPTPIPLPSPTVTGPGITTTYKVDGNTVTGNTVDPTQLSDGNHTVETTATDSSNKVVSKTTTTVKVDTGKSFWQNATLVTKENLATILVLLAVVGIVAGGYFIYRRNLSNTNYMAWPS